MKIDELYKSGKSIFTIDDLRILWHQPDADALKSSVSYFAASKRLIRLRKGIYALSRDYDRLELAQKLISPSYISLDTALQKHGVIFQGVTNITCLARYGRTLGVDDSVYEYHRVKETILTHPLGVESHGRFWMASAERAIADWLYLRGESHFDNLRSIDKALLLQMGDIYGQKSTRALIKKLIASL